MSAEAIYNRLLSSEGEVSYQAVRNIKAVPLTTNQFERYKDAKDCAKCERALHIKNIKKFIRQVRKLYPQLEYRGYLLALDGSYETIYP